jgi:hypothetical protein
MERLDVVKKLVEKRGLDGQIGFTGRVSHSSSMERQPTFFKVTLERDSLSICLFALWFSPSPTRLYKNFKSGYGGLAQRT